MDNILVKNDTKTTALLKSAWGLPDVTHNDDFASLLSLGVEGWQARNWDPAVSEPWFNNYCSDITSDSLNSPELSSLKSTIHELLKAGGYESEVKSLTTPMLNWIHWLKRNVVDSCHGDQDDCFSTRKAEFYAQDDISQDWRSWPYQVRSSILSFIFCLLENLLTHAKYSIVHSGATSRQATLPQKFFPWYHAPPP